jgi:hypothetical protein
MLILAATDRTLGALSNTQIAERSRFFFPRLPEGSFPVGHAGGVGGVYGLSRLPFGPQIIHPQRL